MLHTDDYKFSFTLTESASNAAGVSFASFSGIPNSEKTEFLRQIF